jgi:insulysin
MLRTKEQLGYIVHLGAHHATGCVGIKVIMQSERPALYLEARVEAFLKEARGLIANLTDEEYKKHQEAMKASYLEKHKNLDAEASHYANEISAGTYDFKRSNPIQSSFLNF